MENKKYVFISYSSKDQDNAVALKSFINGKGINTWMAPFDIPPGSKYAEIINKAIKECSCCVMILSNNAQQSVWVAKEIERILNYHKPLIPLSIEDVKLNDEFEFYLSTSQILRARQLDPESEELSKLILTIQRIFSEKSDETVISKESVHPPKAESKTVIMGEYYYGYDKSTKPIEWTVLEEDDEKQLLLSKYVIDNTPYHARGQVLSWKDCSLRNWLNTTFIEKAFSESEKALFLETERAKTKNIFYDTEDKSKCSDKVFLLSVEEVKRYLGTKDRIGCHPTPYAEEKGVFTSGYCLWWIRTPGDSFGMQAYVHAAGGITYDGCYQQRNQVGLRPAVWVKKEK